jgi:hypothetical protein
MFYDFSQSPPVWQSACNRSNSFFSPSESVKGPDPLFYLVKSNFTGFDDLHILRNAVNKSSKIAKIQVSSSAGLPHRHSLPTTHFADRGSIMNPLSFRIALILKDTESLNQLKHHHGKQCTANRPDRRWIRIHMGLSLNQG